MAFAVTRQEGDSLPGEHPDYDIPGRRTERRIDTPLLDIGKLRHVVKTRSTDKSNANLLVTHWRLLLNAGSGFHFEPESYPANTDLITRRQHNRLGDGDIVDHRAVAALLIFQPPLAAPPGDRRVLHAGGTIRHYNGISGPATQSGRRLEQEFASLVDWYVI